MANTNIILYNINPDNYYKAALDRVLHQIRKINNIKIEFISGNWDTNIKYRSSFDRSLQELQPKHYQERDKWVDFVFTTKYFNSDTNSLRVFSTETLAYDRMRLILLFF